MHKLAMERYSRTIRLLHLVITPYLHFPFRLRTWQNERKKKRERREREKKEKNRRKEEKGEGEEKSARRICVGRKPEERDGNKLSFDIYDLLSIKEKI